MNVLYRFYDAEERLLYIGLTINPGRRMERHRGKTWWQDVARIALEHHTDLPSLRAAERLAIETELPLYNVRMNGLREARLNLAEGCAEWIDDADDYCGAPAAFLASPSYNGGLFVCVDHASYYTTLMSVDRVFA